MLRSCSLCKFKGRKIECFSNKQWRRTDEVRRCKQCVAKPSSKPPPPPPKPTPPPPNPPKPTPPTMNRKPSLKEKMVDSTSVHKANIGRLEKKKKKLRSKRSKPKPLAPPGVVVVDIDDDDDDDDDDVVVGLGGTKKDPHALDPIDRKTLENYNDSDDGYDDDDDHHHHHDHTRSSDSRGSQQQCIVVVSPDVSVPASRASRPTQPGMQDSAAVRITTARTSDRTTTSPTTSSTHTSGSRRSTTTGTRKRNTMDADIRPPDGVTKKSRSLFPLEVSHNAPPDDWQRPLLVGDQQEHMERLRQDNRNLRRELDTLQELLKEKREDPPNDEHWIQTIEENQSELLQKILRLEEKVKEETTFFVSNITRLEEEVQTHKRTIEEITARKLYYKQWAQKNDNTLQLLKEKIRRRQSGRT